MVSSRTEAKLKAFGIHWSA